MDRHDSAKLITTLSHISINLARIADALEDNANGGRQGIKERQEYREKLDNTGQSPSSE